MPPLHRRIFESKRSDLVSLTGLASATLGIGVNTAVFDLINTVVLRSLPYAESERLFTLFERDSVCTGLRVASYPTTAD